MLYVTCLVPIILRWFLDFWKSSPLMIYSNVTYSIYSDCSFLEQRWGLTMGFQMNMLVPPSGLRHWVQAAARVIKGKDMAWPLQAMAVTAQALLTTKHTRRSRYCNSIPGKSKIFFSSPKYPDWLWDPPSLQFNGQGFLPWWWSGRGKNLTIPSKYTFMACTWTILPLQYGC
jgi:hypothetical protein